MSEQSIGLDTLQLERIKFLWEQLKKVAPYLDELSQISSEERQKVEQQVADYALSLKVSKLDKDNLEAFFKKPYYLDPVKGRPDSWHLIIPKFVDVQIGWLEKSTESYNVFLINRYMDWLGEIPDAIKKQLDWKPPPELTLEGEELFGSKSALEYAWQRYRPYLSSRDEEKVKINPKRAFELIASLVKDGVLPFSVRPVHPEDLTERKLDFVLRPYQLDAWEKFTRFSNIGVFFPPSTGKTVIGLYAITHIKPPHLIVVPTRLLQEQWEERVATHTDMKLDEEVYVMTYQSAITKASRGEWSCLIVDECHHLPANVFVKLALIKRKYTLGLSATPFREDGREEYVFALTGRPVGLSWDYFKKSGLIKAPVSHVWIVKNFEGKLRQLDTLLQLKKKTIIFSDSIEVGKTIAARFKVPFAYGETKDNMETILSNEVAVVSRVGDEGTSIPEIERVIEISWLGGSRRQELQRTTRLLHSQQESGLEMHILMTLEEYLRDRKRLFSIMDKGFKIVLHKEGVPEKVIGEKMTERVTRPARRDVVAHIEHTPAPQIPASLLERLPGINRTLERLSRTEMAVAKVILSNPGNSYSATDLALATGLSIATISNNAHFGKLEKMGLIRKDGKKYRSSL